MAHVPGGLKAGAVIALFIIDRWTRLEGGEMGIGGGGLRLSGLWAECFGHVVLDALGEHDPYDAHELANATVALFLPRRATNALIQRL